MLQTVVGALLSFHRWLGGWSERALGIKGTFSCLWFGDFLNLEQEKVEVIDDLMIETKKPSQEPLHRQ